VRTAKSGGW